MNFENFLKLLSSGDPKEIITDIVIRANQDPLKRGARFGWVMALQLPYPSYKKIVANTDNSQDSIDEFFTNYYMEDFDGRLKQHLLNYNSVLPDALSTGGFQAS